MMDSRLVRGYATLLTLLVVVTIGVVALNCGKVEDFGLAAGCADVVAVSTWSVLLMPVLVVAGLTSVVGLLATLAMRRIPTFSSFAVWSSVGMLWVTLLAPDLIIAHLPELLLLASIATTALLGIATGISLARSRTS